MCVSLAQHERRRILIVLLQHLVNRSAMASDDGSVPEACLRNVVRLAEGLPAPNKVR